MKIVLSCISILLLSSCSLFKQPVPLVPKFPDPTPELMKKCEDLMLAEGNEMPITDLLKIVVGNYTLYYQCSSRVDGWQEWYVKQKTRYENIKQ